MEKDLIKVSKRITRILRHELDKFTHDSCGFVKVSDIIKSDSTFFSGISNDNIQTIVDNDNKTRFQLQEKNHQLYIRANQGHSSGDINDDTMLETIIEPIEGCFHGTYLKNLDFIRRTGLSRMKRKHIHIAVSDEAKSGKRASCNVKIYINMKLALDEGIKFYRSSNDVILTPGNEMGILEPKYFLKIEFINKN